MNEFTKGVILTLLDKMFNKSRYFDICDLDELGKLLRVNPQAHPNYRELHALHCVHYADMPRVVRQSLQQKVMECLRPDLGIDINTMAFLLTAEGSNFTPIEDETFPRLTRQ